MSRQLAPSSSVIRTWLKDPNLRADALFAALVGGLALVETTTPLEGSAGADTLGYISIVGASISLLFRRHFPLTVLMIVTTVLAVFYARDGGEFLSPIGLSAFYAVAAHSEHRLRAWVAILVAGPGLFAIASVSVLDTNDGFDVDSAAGMSSFLIGVTVIGVFVRHRQRLFADSEQRAAEAEVDRLVATRQAVAHERSRIAREMHDVVAHGMSVISVQAAAAQEIVHTDPDKAAEVMGRIENVGRQSLNEMRRMLDVLRSGDESTPSLAPQPSLADVDAAVAHATDAGVATRLVVNGQRRDLAPGIELAAFRIVQEALTNVLKHAGQQASATVTIAYASGAIAIEVTDDGRGAVSSLTGAGGGNGLIGMRERVEIYGGELSAGPRPGGGYMVEAVLPTEDTDGRPSVGSTAAPLPRIDGHV